MRITIKGVNENGVELELDDEAEQFLEQKTLENLGQDASQEDKEAFKNSLLQIALMQMMQDNGTDEVED